MTRKSLEIARNLLGPQGLQDSQFLDLGCGKGKALLVYALDHASKASHCPVGIEYDPDLANLCLENVNACGFSAADVRVVTDSATNLRNYMTSDSSIIYLYNSFQGATLRAVLSSLSDHPHVLIYVDPAEREVLSDFGYAIEKDVTGMYHADTWLVATSPTLRTLEDRLQP